MPLRCYPQNVQSATVSDSTGGDTIRIPRYAAFVYPLSFIGNHLNVGFEWRLNGPWAVRAVGAFAWAENSSHYDVQNMTSGYIEGQIRLYANDKMFRGFYGAALAYAKVLDFSYQEQQSERVIINGVTQTNYFILGPYQGRATAIGIGYILGYQRQIGKHLLIDAYLGPALQRTNIKGPAEPLIDRNHALQTRVWDNYNSGLKAHLGLGLGWIIY
jgi:hypothetical protein